MSIKKLVILDRDGVINKETNLHIKSPDEWEPITGSLEAIAQLNRAGYHIVVATNQSGLAQGLFDISTLNRIHKKMHEQASIFGAKIDAIFFCPHQANDHCSCRKPAPGLIKEILSRYSIKSSEKIPFVGDSICDVKAAIAGNVQPWLVLTGNGTKTLENPHCPQSVKVIANLDEFVKQFLIDKP